MNIIGDYCRGGNANAIARFETSTLASWSLNWCARRIGQNPDNLYIWPQCCYHPLTQTPSGDLWGCLLKYTSKGSSQKKKFFFGEFCPVSLFISSDRSSYSDDGLLFIRQQLFQIFTQSIDSIDVTSVTLSRLNSINAIDVKRCKLMLIECSNVPMFH